MSLKDYVDSFYGHLGGFQMFMEMHQGRYLAKDIAEYFGVSPHAISNWHHRWFQETGELLGPQNYKKDKESYHHNFNLRYGHLGGVDKFIEMIREGATVQSLMEQFDCCLFTVYDNCYRITGMSLGALRKYYKRESIEIPSVKITTIKHQPYTDEHYAKFGGTEGIVKMVMDGKSARQVGQIVGLSRERISKIFLAATGFMICDYRKAQSLTRKKNRLLREKTCPDCGERFESLSTQVRCTECHIKHRTRSLQYYNALGREKRSLVAV